MEYKQYFLTCNDRNHHQLQESSPVNPAHTVVVLTLTKPQLDSLSKVIIELNQKHTCLTIAAEMRHTQKKYYKAKSVGNQFDKRLYLSTAINLEHCLDKDLATIERSFGKLYQDPTELNLF